MALLDKIVSDDFVWNAVSTAISGRAKRAGAGFLKMNCPMCVMRGEARPDTKQRMGVKNNHPGVGFNCFNCKAIGKWVPGETLSKSMREFMLAIGLSDLEIKKLNHKAATYRRMIEMSPRAQALVQTSFSLDFPSKPLPPGAASFENWADRNCSDPNFLRVADYLFGRGNEIAGATTYFWTPHSRTNLADPKTEARMNERVIIPFYRGEKLVGWTARACDEKIIPKYHSESPPDYLFNNHVMDLRERQYIVITEGPFDALAIDGVASLGAKMNDRQAAWIDSAGKIPIVVPDGDRAGQSLIDVALKRGWRVAFPRMKSASQKSWWDSDVKDCAEAVKRYGRLYTLTSILKTTAHNRIEIEMKRKMI